MAAAAAAAKSLQSCPTLCDPIDRSRLGSPVPGILQARTLEWVAISFSSAWKWKVKVKSINRVWLFKTPWTAAPQAPPSMGVSRQEYWSGVPSPATWHHTSILTNTPHPSPDTPPYCLQCPFTTCNSSIICVYMRAGTCSVLFTAVTPASAVVFLFLSRNSWNFYVFLNSEKSIWENRGKYYNSSYKK